MAREQLYDSFPVKGYRAGEGFGNAEDPVIRESSVRIWLNGEEIVAILALKQELEELAVGYLYNECLITDPSLIEKVDVNERLVAVMVETREELNTASLPTVRAVTTGCGKGVAFINPMKADHFPKIKDDTVISAADITRLMSEFGKSSELFRLTGAVHAAAWSDGKEIVKISEDIGRHNCIDKLTGWKLRNPDSALDAKVVLSTGRISSEIVAKAARSSVPILISHSAPTTGALYLARELGMTLVGFVRGERFNIYTRDERICE